MEGLKIANNADRFFSDNISFFFLVSDFSLRIQPLMLLSKAFIC